MIPDGWSEARAIFPDVHSLSACLENRSWRASRQNGAPRSTTPVGSRLFGRRGVSTWSTPLRRRFGPSHVHVGQPDLGTSFSISTALQTTDTIRSARRHSFDLSFVVHE